MGLVGVGLVRGTTQAEIRGGGGEVILSEGGMKEEGKRWKALRCGHWWFNHGSVGIKALVTDLAGRHAGASKINVP